MELTLLQFCKEVVQLESAKNLLDMLLMRFHVLAIDEDVVEVHNNTDIQHVSEDSVNKSLECCRSISGTKGHYQPFIRSIVGMKSCFPLISRHNSDKMVHMPEIYLGVDFGQAGGVQKARDQGEWIAILFGNFIKASKVNAESERTILLFYKKDQSSMVGSSGADKSSAEIFIYEGPESGELNQR